MSSKHASLNLKMPKEENKFPVINKTNTNWLRTLDDLKQYSNPKPKTK